MSRRPPTLELLPYGIARKPRLELKTAFALLDCGREDADMELNSLTSLVESLLTDKTILDMIRVVSPSLAMHWMKGERNRDAVHAMARYLLRAASRTAPFGPLASVGAVHWGADTVLPSICELPPPLDRDSPITYPVAHKRGNRICITDPLPPHDEHSIRFAPNVWHALRGSDGGSREEAERIVTMLSAHGIIKTRAPNSPRPSEAFHAGYIKLPSALSHALIQRARALTVGYFPSKDKLRLLSYARAFSNRYYHEWVPVTDVADPYISQLPLPRSSRPSETFEPALTRKRAAWLHAITEDALRANNEVDVTTEDLKENAVGVDECSSAGFEVSALVYAESFEALNQGHFTLYPAPLSTTKAAFMSAGRFLWGLPASLASWLREYQARIERSDRYVHAEIVFAIGDDRDLLRRTEHGWSHELVVNGRVQQLERRTLHLEDILVGSTSDETLSLRLRDGRNVALHQGHMWNPQLGPPVVQVLNELSWRHAAAPEPFNWVPLLDASFRPRVVWNRQVLSLANWRIHSRSEALRDSQSLRKWRRHRGVPRIVALVGLGGTFAVNLDSHWGLSEIRRAARNADEVVLEEAPWLEPAVARNGIILEIAASFGTVSASREEIHSYDSPANIWPLADVDRAWTSIKILLPSYCHLALAQQLRERFVEPGVPWHFVRLVDSSGADELRFRFRASTPSSFFAEARRLACDAGATYVSQEPFRPEQSRYGGPAALQLAFNVMTHDSMSALADTLDQSGDHALYSAARAQAVILTASLGQDGAASACRARTSDRSARNEIRRLRSDANLVAQFARQIDTKDALYAAAATWRDVVHEARSRHLGAMSFAHIAANRRLGARRDLERVSLGVAAGLLFRHSQTTREAERC